MRPDDVIAALSERLGAELVSTDAQDIAAHARDGFGPQRPYPPGLAHAAVNPIAVVRPRCAAEVSSLLRLAAEHRFAVVPYGGGTGLMGGATPRSPAVALSLSAMRRIREVRPADQMVWAEAGATLAEVDAALRPYGLMAGHDPWTFSLATVGGAIGTNGLGYLGGRYGSMGDQTLAIEAVLASGAVVSTPAVTKRSTGLDLRGLFVGTEGTLGIVTAAALHAFPIPEERLLRAYVFSDFAAGLEAIGAMAAIGLAPALLDYGESFPAPSPAGPGRRRPDGRDAADPGANLYLGFEGFREEAEAAAFRAARICREHGSALIDTAEVRAFWEDRHAIADRFAERRATGATDRWLPRDARFDFVHVALPPSRVAPYWRAARELCQREAVHVMEAGLWVRPGLFSLGLLKRARSGRSAEAALAATVDALLRLGLEHGGSMEYCHGVGVRLAHLMAEEHGADGLEAMRAVKRALDPEGILNPGKLAL